jgi:trigger factor
MNINVEHQPNCRAAVHIRVPGDEVTSQRNQLITYFSRNARIQGFRPGKAPKKVIEKRYGKDIAEELEKQLVNDGVRQAVQSEGLDVLAFLDVKDKLHHDTDGSFSFTVEMSLQPKFELPEYKGIPVKLPRIEVTEADVDQDIVQLRENFASLEDVDRGAGNGDAVVGGYVTEIDGQPLEEAHPEAPDYLKKMEEQWFLLAEEEDFLPGFYEGLQGIQKDESRDVSVTLPDDFSFEDLQGKTVVLKVSCSAVKERTLPELDDEFLKKVGGEEMTLDSLRTEVKASVQKRREQARDTAKSNQVIGHIAEKIEFELPQDVVNREAQRRTNEIASQAMQNGMDNEALMQHQEEILNTATQQARQNVKVSFILEQVAKAEGIQVSDQQLSMTLAMLASRNGQQPKKFMAEAQKNGMIERVRDDLLIQNALQFLKDNAEVEETDPESEIQATSDAEGGSAEAS